MEFTADQARTYSNLTLFNKSIFYASPMGNNELFDSIYLN